MDIIFEILLELILDGSIEASKNKKMPKIIRYFFIMVILIFLAIVDIGIIILGIILLKNNIIISIGIIIYGVILSILSIRKFRKLYLRKSNK